MSHFKGVKGKIILMVLLAMIVAYFFYLSNKSTPVKEETAKISAVQEVLLRDLEHDYPPSPKEVIKYYGEITRCFYSETYSEDEFIALSKRARELYDNDLIANQTEEIYLKNLRKDVQKYKKDEIVISSYAVSSSADVTYATTDGFEFAQLYCVFSIRQGQTIEPRNEKFLLRKDNNGHWKIYGWKLTEEEKYE